MNLPQAISDFHQHGIAKQMAEETARALLAQREAYKVERYFQNCLPGCKRGSLTPADHVSRVAGLPPTCRILYQQVLKFFAGGRLHRERAFIAANRIGKTDAAAFEIRGHMTGRYPKWWPGKRFEGATKWWAAGDTRLTTRDIVQTALMGPHTGVPMGSWSGMLDPHLIVDVVRASGGVANCLDTVYVQHVERHHGAPCISELGFKSYDQGRRVFQGTEQHGIWLDEEPPDGADRAEAEAQGSSDIWTECLLRTMTTNGLIIATFTPLRGMTPFMQSFLETAVMPDTADVSIDDDGTDAYDGLLARAFAQVEAKSHFFPDILDGGAA